jgi:phage-related protein
VDVANILLRITGDADDAKRELAETARAIAGIDGQEADATVDVDTRSARTKLKAFRLELARLAREKVTVAVNIDEQGMQRGMRAVLARTGGSGGGGGPGFLRSVSFGPFNVGARAFLVLGPAVLALFGALAAAAGALVASLASAAAGVGALGVSFASLLAPAIALGVGAVSRFKDTVDKAGSAAHELSRVGKSVADTFNRTLAPASDAVFRGMSDALRSIQPMLASLRPAFTQFGQAVGNAFRALGQEFASPVWRQFFDFLIRSAARVTPILTQAFMGFARVLRNIATAAMPFLIDGFRSLAQWIGRVARSTSDIGSLRESIGGLVDHLRSWGNLAGELGRVVLNFFRAAAPAGQVLVDKIAALAGKWADWLASTEGQGAVRDFLDRVIPLAESLAGVVGELVKLWANWIELVEPVLRPLLELLEKILEAVNKIIDALNDLPDPVDDIAGAIALITGGAGLGAGLRMLTRGFGTLPSIVGRAGTAIARFATGPVGLGVAAFIALKDATKTAWSDILPGGNSAKAILSIEAIRARVNALRTAFQGAQTSIQAAGQGIEHTADGILIGLARIRGGAHAMGRGVRQAVEGVGRAAAAAAGHILPALENVGSRMSHALRNGIRGAGRAVIGAAQHVTRNAAAGARSLGDSFRDVGRALTNALGDGVKSAASTVANAARGVGQAAADAVKGFASSFSAAGKAMGDALAAGFASAKEGAIAVAAGVAQGMRNVFHGSEPKDPRSPLRNFDQAGHAFIDEYLRGIRAAAPRLRAALHSEFNVTPLLTAPSLGAAPAPAGSPTYNQEFNLAAPAAHGMPDPKAVVAQIALQMRMEGMRA